MNPYKSELNEVSALICSLINTENRPLLKEINSLLQSEDDVVILLYSRRYLEVIVTELCETYLERERGSEPMKGLIDRLFKDKIIPSFIHTSMSNLNNNSTYGAHPKEFDKRQVKTSLIDLSTILEWYFFDLKKMKRKFEPETNGAETQQTPTPLLAESLSKIKEKPAFYKRPVFIVAAVLAAILIVAAYVILLRNVPEVKQQENLSNDSITYLPVAKKNNPQTADIAKKDTTPAAPKKSKNSDNETFKLNLPDDLDVSLLMLSDKSSSPTARKAAAKEFLKRFVPDGRVDILKNGYWIETKNIEDYLNWVIVSGSMYSIKVADMKRNANGIELIKVEQEKK
jgi:hypothetical protein